MLDTYTWIAVNHCVPEENVLEINGMKAWSLNKLIKGLKKMVSTFFDFHIC